MPSTSHSVICRPEPGVYLNVNTRRPKVRSRNTAKADIEVICTFEVRSRRIRRKRRITRKINSIPEESADRSVLLILREIFASNAELARRLNELECAYQAIRPEKPKRKAAKVRKDD